LLLSDRRELLEELLHPFGFEEGRDREEEVVEGVENVGRLRKRVVSSLV
jgi:hypothetical protein